MDPAGVAHVTGSTNSDRGTFPIRGRLGTQFDAFAVAVGAACRGKVATIAGTSGKDKLYGEEGKDTLIGQAGSDTWIGDPLTDRAKDCEKERQV